MNYEQKEELYSLRCIYEDSDQVKLQLPQLDEQREDGLPIVNLKVAISAQHKIEMKITLLEQYLELDSARPLYELTSQTVSQDRLRLLHEHLDSVTESPVLFSWIEWLRTESNGLLHPPVNQEVPSIARETSSDSIDFNDIPESGPESETEAVCANCVAPCSATVKLRACGHWLCGNCSSSTWQVYSSQGSHPRCPLPTCRTLATQLGTDCTLELWLKVSKHIVTTRFQDSIVFCPRCEDRGMDIPVLVQPSNNSSEYSRCHCFKCHLSFCGVCRSPPHPGASCFDCERRVVRMAKRRPPLPVELAELAAQKAEEIQERDKRQAELAFSLSQGSNSFQDLVDHFEHQFGPVVLEGLESVFENVELREAKLSKQVQDRFFHQISKHGVGEMRPAFHGTDSKNYGSILDRGLLIPGFGLGADLKIVHGAAHGRGIYTANVDAAYLSQGFCSDPSMLVCAVLDCDKQVHHVGDAMVVMDPAFVVPIFLAVGSWKTARGLGAVGPGRFPAVVPAPVAPNPVALKAQKVKGKAGQLEPEKPKDPKAAKPKAKQSKFLARLAARSKKH